MYYIDFHGQSFRPDLVRAKSLHAAKKMATKLLEYNMSATIYKWNGDHDEEKEYICTKEFYNNGDRFGWNDWTNKQ